MAREALILLLCLHPNCISRSVSAVQRTYSKLGLHILDGREINWKCIFVRLLSKIGIKLKYFSVVNLSFKCSLRNENAISMSKQWLYVKFVDCIIIIIFEENKTGTNAKKNKSCKRRKKKERNSLALFLWQPPIVRNENLYLPPPFPSPMGGGGAFNTINLYNLPKDRWLAPLPLFRAKLLLIKQAEWRLRGQVKTICTYVILKKILHKILLAGLLQKYLPLFKG